MTRPRINSATIACALLLATATHAHQVAPTTDGRAPRGASGSIEITSVGVPIRAKPASDTTAPILVRVTPLTADRYRIEYLGLVSGHYDLAPYIEQVDGRAATTLGTIEVDVFTQLPPNAPTDVFGLDAPTFGISAYYRMILAICSSTQSTPRARVSSVSMNAVASNCFSCKCYVPTIRTLISRLR